MPGHSARRSYLIELLWPSIPYDRARHMLRQALFHVYNRTRQEVLRADEMNVSLDTGLVDVDQGKSATEMSRWVDSENERIRVGLDVSFSRMIDSALAREKMEAALTHARRYVNLDPFNDSAQLSLLRTLKAAGNEAEALLVYEGYRTRLKDERHREPSDQLKTAISEFAGAGNGGAAAESDASTNGGGVTQESAFAARNSRLTRRSVAATVIGGIALGSVAATVGIRARRSRRARRRRGFARLLRLFTSS
jgi:DNA-binding SARP family transcriptional activator